MRLTLLSLAGLALVNAASVPGPFDGARTIHQLLARQTSSDSDFDPNDIPSQCQTPCNTFSSAVISCQSSTQASCGCSTATEQGLVTCLNCLISLSSSVTAQAQGIVDKLVADCGTAGVKLPAATVSGGVAASQTATGNLPAPSGGSSGNSGSGNSGSGSSNSGSNTGDNSGSSNSGSSNSGSSNSGSNNSGSSSSSGGGNPLTGGASTSGAVSRMIPEAMASSRLVLVSLFYALAA
ncbi:hypothetical protein BD779DRAFT_769213 [Infundibulicybe gibba]|nr:hypothetical protein BD779DRAFT_769213 [Infundibulicybe gibba]